MNISPHGSKSMILGRTSPAAGRGGMPMGFGKIDLGAVRLKKSATASTNKNEQSELAPAVASPDSPVQQKQSESHRPATIGRTTSLHGEAFRSPTKPSLVSSPGASRSSPNLNAGIDSLLQWCKSIAEKYDGVSGNS